MARLGKKPVKIQEGVKVSQKDGKVIFEGSKGKLEQEIFPNLEVSVEGSKIVVKNLVSSEDRKLYRKTEALQGLLRRLILNRIKGVKEGFEKILEIHGVGYKSEVKGKKVLLSIGHSIPTELDIPNGVEVEIVKNTIVFVRGTDKQLVGNYSAVIRATCPPEPYKGKGIRYRGEYVRHKAGKTGAGAAQ
jgi:large subunit ribosomal protein L6